jgi:sec-independent protein translocase protein TatA
MIGDILQPTHLLFVLVVALLVLGPKRLPEAGRALGKGIRDFRSAMSGDDDHNGSIPAQTTASAPSQAPAPPPAFADPPPTPAYSEAARVEPTGETSEQPSETAHPVG